jgi:hypothetical protein
VLDPNQIPPPSLRVLDNQTPFRVLQSDKMGPGRRFFDVVAVKGSFDLAPGVLSLASTDEPFRVSDEPWSLGAAERSSLKYAGEIVLVKPATDVYVTGSVSAPGDEPKQEWDVGVAIKDERETLARLVMTATGPRAFRHSALGGWVLSDPEPTTKVPIRYELAYGGPQEVSPSEPRARNAAYLANPSGVGETAGAPDRAVVYPAPQWQFPASPVTSLNSPVPPAGLGPIPRHWAGRARYAGTYDAAWRERARTQPADYAPDFDLRFFQSAPSGLICPRYLRGDEWLALHNMVPGLAALATRLPRIALGAVLETSTRAGQVRLPLDTVHVDLDAMRVNLVWRLTIPQTLGVERCQIGATRIA